MESGTYPDLHPDLVPYLEPMEHFGQMLRHPLVFAVPYFGAVENERLNKGYEFRKARRQEALDKGNHGQYVFVHERPYRLDALMELHGEIPVTEFSKLMLDVYVDSENVGDNLDTWLELLEPLTGTDPWGSVNQLPDGKFKIYRGGNKEGVSWTLDRTQAQWFAGRWQENHPVWEATVTRDDVIGYYNGRGEKEVIVYPPAIIHLIESDPTTN